MSDDSSYGDFSKYNEDSVPEPEEVSHLFIFKIIWLYLQPIEKNHPGRPDLDYDETPVGPAPEVEECQEREEERQSEE